MSQKVKWQIALFHSKESIYEATREDFRIVLVDVQTFIYKNFLESHNFYVAHSSAKIS